VNNACADKNLTDIQMLVCGFLLDNCFVHVKKHQTLLFLAIHML
jgi:hypothetical protein